MCEGENEDPLQEKSPEDYDALINAPEVETILVTRLGWGAKEPAKPLPPLQHPVGNVVMAYNTDVDPCHTREQCVERMRELQQRHLDIGLDDIHYNFLVGTDGTVYEGRGWDYQPGPFMVRPELDEKSICIGVIGDGNEPDDAKPLELIEAIYVAQYGIKEGYIIHDYNMCEDTQTFEIKPPT